jgi:hypothetical protein
MVNPGEYPPMGFSSGPGFDGLVTVRNVGPSDLTADLGTLRVTIDGRQLVCAAGGQTGDGYVRRAPVPGAVLLAVFGLGLVGLSWRRFA